MNKIIRDHYPVSRLPEDLRQGLPLDGEARIVVESRPKRRGYTLDELLAMREAITPATDDPVQRIRALRDEWD